MAKLNVEHVDGWTAWNSYGHAFNNVEEAKDYLERHGGGTIAIVPDDWDDDETSGWQPNFEYECTCEVLIVVEAADENESQAALNAGMNASIRGDEIVNLQAIKAAIKHARAELWADREQLPTVAADELDEHLLRALALVLSMTSDVPSEEWKAARQRLESSLLDDVEG
jgi:hypothetical protein